MKHKWTWVIPLSLGLLLACGERPKVKVKPLPGVEIEVPLEVQKTGKMGLVIKILPGNPLPGVGEVFTDDFSRYPTGAVLPVVNPKDYGLLRFAKDWQLVTVVETFDPTGKLDKGVRIEEGYGGGLLTTGAQDWSDYEVGFRLKVKEAPYTESGVRFRLFMDGAGTRALELMIGYGGLKLDKLAGDQRFTLIDRRELASTGETLLRDQSWHNLRFALESSGRVRFWLDESLLLDWTDPDYQAGGFGVGPKGSTFFIDDFQIRRL